MCNEVDNKIISILEKKVENDSSFWDFKDNYKKEHIHAIIDYPATMVPKMQAELMDIIINQNIGISNVLDPFMGSGTILVEGMLRGIDIIGMDINPLAYLITKVKTHPVKIEQLEIKINELFKRLDESNLKYEITSFPGIDKWFRNDFIINLSKIRYTITLEKDVVFRRLFWISFCQIVRVCCNSQKSTFKLHIKKIENIDNFNYDCIEAFKNHVLETKINMIKYEEILGKKIIIRNKVNYKNNISIMNGDSVKLIRDKRRFKDNSIDMISTSPPYGDNHTTVTYGQYSILQLKWIDLKDIDENIDVSLIDKLTEIDKRSLGGIFYSCEYIENSSIFNISPTLEKIYYKLISQKELEKARKVASFYIDFNNILKNCFRVLKPEKYAIFTIGNRRVNNEIIEFNKIIKELAEDSNGKLIYDFSRNILNKRIPGRISKLKTNESVKSIKEENILIFRKDKSKNS